MSQLSFKVQGEFITKLAREKFYQDNDISYALKLLLNCTETDQISYEERLGICIQILDGKAYLEGTYPNEDYGLVETPDEEPLGFCNHISDIANKLKESKDELNNMYRKFNFFVSKACLSDYQMNRIDNAYFSEYGEYMFDNSKEPAAPMDSALNTMLYSFLDRKHAENDKNLNYNPEEDYGWLEPNGTYHPVEWGEHSSWAQNYCDEHYPFKEYADMYWKTDANGERHHYVNGDFLVYCLGWVLLDSPYQGVATPKYDPSRRLTNAQREFLYGYYIDRDMKERANKIWNED